MSKVKLTGESSGYVEISAGTAAGNNTLELPTSGDKIISNNYVGVVTASTFSGDVTVGTGATISGSTDTIIASTNGSERLRIDSSGNVGIGTDNPISELMVENATQSHISVKTSGSNMAKFGSKGNDVYIGGTAGAANIIFKRNIVSIDHPADSGTETVRIDSSNNVQIANGNLVFSTSGKGIDFSAKTPDSSGTVSSEILDDYEEGTWTPGITNLGDHTTNAASTWGKYTKVGNRVWITWRYQWSGRSTTNGSVPVYLDNLPYTSANDGKQDAVYIGGIEGVIASNSGRPHYGGSVLGNNTRIIFRASGENVSENSLQGSNATSLSSGYIYGAANYIAA